MFYPVSCTHDGKRYNYEVFANSPREAFRKAREEFKSDFGVFPQHTHVKQSFVKSYNGSWDNHCQ